MPAPSLHLRLQTARGGGRCLWCLWCCLLCSSARESCTEARPGHCVARAPKASIIHIRRVGYHSPPVSAKTRMNPTHVNTHTCNSNKRARAATAATAAASLNCCAGLFQDAVDTDIITPQVPQPPRCCACYASRNNEIHRPGLANIRR